MSPKTSFVITSTCLRIALLISASLEAEVTPSKVKLLLSSLTSELMSTGIVKLTVIFRFDE